MTADPHGTATVRGFIATAALAGLAGCGGGPDPARLAQARTLIAADCAACHQVPGVSGAKGRVGPSLAGIAKQQIIAGHFANTPETLVSWIEHPQHMLPGNAMPEMGLSHEQARTIAAYLYTLEDR
ncbi:MAG: cytochrome c class [Gammaproteobacteria bacterium]|jgi:cytochrome c2|nr:cytochrome c class [Gammaproteobacteria bacterium]